MSWRSTALVSLVAVAAAIALAFASPSGAAPPAGVLATDAGDGPVAAVGDMVAFSRWDAAAGGYRLVVVRDGAAQTLPVAPAVTPFAVSAGLGPDGAPWLVWSRCNSDERVKPATDCDVEGWDVGSATAKSFSFAARKGVVERAPSISGDLLAFAVASSGNGVAQVHLAKVDGSADAVVAAVPPTTCALSILSEYEPVARATVQSTALRAGALAVTSRVSTSAVDIGICGLADVRLVDLATRTARDLATSVCGLGGQQFGDLGFDLAGRLWWRESCPGDPSACMGTAGGPFRLTALRGIQRLVQSAGARVSGVAIAGRTPVLAVRAAGSPAGCWTGEEGLSGYRCTTVTAIAAPTFAAVRSRVERKPPPGYRTVKLSATLRLLRPPAALACARGVLIPRRGAVLWAGASAYAAGRPTRGTDAPVVARSGRLVVTGTVAAGPKGWEGQRTTALVLGRTRAVCGRTWTLTYRPAKGRVVQYRTRVLAG